MKYKEAGCELDRLFEGWKNETEVAVFGLGIWCRQYIEEIRSDIKISVIIDNNPELQGSFYQGIPVISFQEYLEKYRNVKILISVYYNEISKQLLESGLVEQIDFCDMNMYVSLWYWFNRGKVHFTRVNSSITTKCTLNCRHCNMFMPFYKEPAHIPYEEVCENFDLMFRHVDRIYAVSLLGGEPFLHPRVNDIIKYLGTRYRDKIGELSFITNATITLSSETLELLKKYNVFMQISDYTNAVPYTKKYEQFCETLTEYGIPYRIVNYDNWLDFGFPVTPWNLDDNLAEKHFMDCYPIFRGVNDNNFYFCHVSWSAQKAGLFQNPEEDYIRLDKLEGTREDKIRLLEYNLGFTHKGYIDLCKRCGGCGSMNKAQVQAGVQMKAVHTK